MTTQVRASMAVWAICGLFFVPAAWADFGTHQLDGNASALPGFTGHEDFLATGIGGKILNIRVDYAVFAPGAFTGTSTPLPPSPALNPSDYVYGYQIFNLGTANGGTGNTELSELTVATTAPVASLGYDAGFDPSPSDVSPSFGSILPEGFLYGFIPMGLLPDQFSTVLVMGSPYAPTYMSATIQDGGTTSSGRLPSPVPEPASAAAMLAGLAVLLKQRRTHA
jgi:hypothetical protein